MASILVRDVDLFFRGKLEAQLSGFHDLVTSGQADLAIVDIGKIDLVQAVHALAGMPVVAFTTHTDTAGLRAAHQAGFDRVVTRSLISRDALKMVNDLIRLHSSSI